MNTQEKIEFTCDSIKKMLLDKNKKYGDSALKPVRIFSKSNAVEQILVRIDDKLSRISKGAGLLASDEDVVNDLIGYLVLLKIAQNQDTQNSKDSDLGSEVSRSRNCCYDEIVAFIENSKDEYSHSQVECYHSIDESIGNNVTDPCPASGQEDLILGELYASGDRFA